MITVNPLAYGPISRTALAALDQKRGECFPWVRTVVQAATGRLIGADYNTGYLQAGATEVPLLGARDGDIIQIANPANTAPNADYPGLHTAIVLDNQGGGKFRVIDSNSNFDGVVRIREGYSPAELVARYPGVVVRVYRFSGVATGPGTPGAAPTATVATSTPGTTTAAFAGGTPPAPGTSVIVAADGDCLRVRSVAGLVGTVLGCLPSGSRAMVTMSGPTVDGFRWVQVSAGAISGWVAADYLNATTDPAPGTGSSSSSNVTAPPAAPFTPAAAASGGGGRFAAAPVFAAGSGLAAAVFMGGSLDQLVNAATDAQASGVWVQDAAGSFQLLIVNGPAFMTDAFRARVPGPFSGPVAVTLIGRAS